MDTSGLFVWQSSAVVEAVGGWRRGGVILSRLRGHHGADGEGISAVPRLFSERNPGVWTNRTRGVESPMAIRRM